MYSILSRVSPSDGASRNLALALLWEQAALLIASVPP
jgi:hypothetical protein